MSQVVVAVVSPSFLESKWCFAETTQARALGKPLLPVRIHECSLPGTLRDRQAIDLTSNPDEGYDRLRRALNELLGGAVALDAERPYPGLAPYDGTNAGAFAGRDGEVTEALERLERMRHRGTPRLLAVFGASGSGKSSLLLAGVLPRVATRPESWIALPAIRHRGDPTGEVARAFATAFGRAGVKRDWRELSDTLNTAVEADGHAWVSVANDLKQASDRPAASILLALDQFEEFLDTEPAEAAQTASFCTQLRKAAEHPASPIILVATIRSDFLETMQGLPAFDQLPLETMLLGPMSMDRLDRVIRRPAERLGVEFDNALTQKLIADTRDAEGLPRLAFTLEQLWKLREHDRITLEQYSSQLGSINEAIARVAESDIDLKGTDEMSIRAAFLRMAHLTDEGRLVKRAANWDDIPEPARPTIERLVESHLLVSNTVDGVRRVEVIHEFLFRAWKRLSDWLDGERELMLFQRRLSRALAEYDRLNHDPGTLLQGARLSEAEKWLADRPDEFTVAEHAYISASSARHQLELKKEAKRRRRTNAWLVVGIAVTLSAAIVMFALYKNVTNERRARDARALSAIAAAQDDLTVDDVATKLLLAAESLKQDWSHDAFWILRKFDGRPASWPNIGGKQTLSRLDDASDSQRTRRCDGRSDRDLAAALSRSHYTY